MAARMAPDMAAWVGLIPPLLAVLYGGWCGNLLGGVTAAGSSTALAALLLTLAAFAGPWRDPLRLGRAGGLAPLALWGAVAASALASPVPRAGLEAVVLLPAYLCLPGAVARCWSGEAARRLGGRGMAAAVAALAAWALLAARSGADAAVSAAAGRPGDAVARAEPGIGATFAGLGHHSLLATWLATLLPLALLPLRERSGWRWLGAAAGALGIAAVLAGQSLAGGAALACEALLAGIWFLGSGGTPARRRLTAALALLGLALAATQLPRLVRIGGRHDPSALARSVYLQAGWKGWREHPGLGWGPGSTGWTAAWFLAPRAGLNPWGEAVGELHSLPVHLLYETGAAGLLGTLWVIGWFLRRRLSERGGGAADPALLAAGCLGLAGAGVAWLGTAALAVAALPMAAVLAAGAALAGGSAARVQDGMAPRIVAGGFRPSPAACIYGLAAAAALLAPELARWHYDRAVAAGQAGRRQAAAGEVAVALRLDPSFPLYRLRLALLQGDDAAGRAAASALAWRAARDAGGVGLLWMAAGILGSAGGEAWAPSALEQSCSLDPFAPFPPFYLAAMEPQGASAPRLAARALLAEPRLAAATFWEGREALFRLALEEVRRWPGVDAGWKLALLRAAPLPEARRGASQRLGLIIDGGGFNQSTSLHLFRRLPWPTLWPLVAVRGDLLAALGLPPPTSLPSTDGAPFETGGCRPRG
jgi:hypothetical protein